MPRRRTVKALSPGRRKGATNSAIRYLGEIGDTWRDNGRLGRRSLGCRQGITRQCHAPSPILAVPDNRDGHMYRIDACRRQMGAGVSIGVSIRSTRRPSRPRDKFYVADCEVYCKEQTWRRAPAESISGQQEDAEHVGQFQDGGPHESPSIRTIDHHHSVEPRRTHHRELAAQPGLRVVYQDRSGFRRHTPPRRRVRPQRGSATSVRVALPPSPQDGNQ